MIFLTQAMKYWRVILLALILGVTFYYKTRYERTAQAFDAFKQELAIQTRLQQEKNAIIEANTQKSVQAEIEKHKQIADKLNLDRNKIAKDLHNAQTLNDYRIGAYADRLRINTSNSTLPETASDTCGITQTERERDTAYIATLEQAGASCALDFNLARGWIDAVCANRECN